MLARQSMEFYNSTSSGPKKLPARNEMRCVEADMLEGDVKGPQRSARLALSANSSAELSKRLVNMAPHPHHFG